MAVNPSGADMKAFVVYFGHGVVPLVAEDGQGWDAVLLVSYPSRRAFSDMVRDPGYQEGTHLRTEALVEAVLQPTVPVVAPSPAGADTSGQDPRVGNG